MLPVIGIAAAALFLANCFRRNEDESTPPPVSDKPEPVLGFDDKSEAFKIYQQLKKAGVKDPDLDQGCHTIDYIQPGPNETLVGKADRRISTCEVYEYALDNYEKYREIAEGITGKPIPWTLDDHNPNTHFDEQIRTKVRGAITQLNKILISQKLIPGTEAYKEKLAVALFYFTAFPDDPTKIQSYQARAELKKVSQELEQIGLKDFQEILFNKGGLGTLLMVEDSPFEADALEALQTKKGWCTERSKILYAVYKMAGLNPFFVYTHGADLITNLPRIPRFPNTPRNEIDGHVYIGLPLGSKNRFFDLAVFRSNAKDSSYYPLRLAQYFSADLNNRGVGQLIHGKIEKAIQTFLKSIELDSNSPLTQGNLARARILQENFERALPALLKQMEHSRKDSPILLYNLGLISWAQKDFKAAEEIFLKIIRLTPNDTLAYVLLALSYHGEKRRGDALNVLSRAYQIDPQNERVAVLFAIEFWLTNQYPQAAEVLYKILSKNSDHKISRHLLLSLAITLFEQKEMRSSVGYVQELMTYYPKYAGFFFFHFLSETKLKSQALQKILEEDLKIIPDKFRAAQQLSLGYALHLQGKTKEAQIYFDSSKKINPEFYQIARTSILQDSLSEGEQKHRKMHDEFQIFFQQMILPKIEELIR
jgi:tetratricopeptide (TPR) repeat protein